MKKFSISVIILLVFAAAIFVLGWLEIFVPVDKVGILVSKTSGVSQEIIKPGNFTWSWERIIPTNSQIRIFTAVPQTITKDIRGSLPSAELYKNMIDGSPDFSYNFSVKIVMSIKESELPAFVEKTGAKDEDNLTEYLNSQADSIARATVQYILEESVLNSSFVVEASLTDTELIDGIDAANRYDDISITSIQINNVSMPDITMYNLAKNSYEAYQIAVETALESSFELEGFDAAQDYLELERLSRLGQVLADYPQLIDFMAVSNGEMDFNVPNTPQVSDISQ